MVRKEFLKVLARYGATLDVENEQDGNDLVIDSPKGKIFNATLCHVIVEPFANHGGQSWKSKAYQEAASRVELGVSDCFEPDCDICNSCNAARGVPSPSQE